MTCTIMFGISAPKLLNESRWNIWGGGRVSKDCGLLLDRHAFVFSNPGERILATTDLDLSTAT